jgi:hypothetical protein
MDHHTVETKPKRVLGDSTTERKKKKEKPSATVEIERKIKSMRKKASAQSASIERLYVAQDINVSNDELTFDRRVEEEFKSIVEYKDYIVNYERLSKLPTFNISFKTQLVDEDVNQVKSKSRKKMLLKPIAETVEADDWKQDLRTITIRNRLVRIDDDKGLVYSSTYELIGTVEEFEMMDEENEVSDAQDIDENNNLNI